MKQISLQEAVEHLPELPAERLPEFIAKTIFAFQAMQLKISSLNLDERAEGLKSASELKALLDVQLQNIQSQLGMNEVELKEHLGNPDHFSASELQFLDEAKIEFHQFKQ